jgi:hypothetical protein
MSVHSKSLSRRWPLKIADHYYSGFSDLELEMLCADKSEKFGLAPRLFWTTEIYGFGRCYRDWLNWPNCLPIPVYGDHGVSIRIPLQPHERDNKARFHFVWNKIRAENNCNIPGRTVLRIPHPYILYRRKHKIERCPESRGTLVFFAHTIDGIEIDGYQYDKYFDRLRDLPEQYKPLVICLHMHDIRKGYHRKIRKYGFPIVSAGFAMSPFFVDRFYDLITRFQYATSNSGGSELFYCVELGIPYFLYGDKPTYVNKSHNQLPLGVMTPMDFLSAEIEKEKKKLFSVFPPHINEAQLLFVRNMLGLDVSVDAKRIRSIFIREMIRLLPFYLAQFLLRRIRKIKR